MRELSSKTTSWTEHKKATTRDHMKEYSQSSAWELTGLPTRQILA